MSRAMKLRILPPVVFFLLCALAYLCYARFQTTEQDDPVDGWLALGLSTGSFFVAGYVLVRTIEWRPQILGAVGFLMGGGVFYGIIALSRLGIADISNEVLLDLVRSFASVGLLVMIGGIAFFEWSMRRGQELSHDVGIRDDFQIDPSTTTVYDRRSGKDRRRDRGRLPSDPGRVQQD